MSYGSGRLPMERASKLGQVRVIEHEQIVRLLRQFEQNEMASPSNLGSYTGRVDLSLPSSIRFIVTVDGGQATIPSNARRGRRLAFVTACAMFLDTEDINRMRRSPIIDPRSLAALFTDRSWDHGAVLPLAGVGIPGQTVKETIRRTVDAALEYTQLYGTLADLVFRTWDPTYVFDACINHDAPHMDCLQCGHTVYLQRGQLAFRCQQCGHDHRLSDYLGITQGMPDEWTREEAAINLRNVLETLTLFHLILRYWRTAPDLLRHTLFLKDGPLLLRAQLGRLVQPIRDLMQTMRKLNLRVHVAGVEKNGDLVEHAESLKEQLLEPGDYFIPSVRYMLEEVAGLSFDITKYRNRAQYGAKVVVRLGPDHVVPLDIPTGDFLVEPRARDLIGLEETVRILSRLPSHSHDNALIPIKLANAVCSIAEKPAVSILRDFADRILSASGGDVSPLYSSSKQR